MGGPVIRAYLTSESETSGITRSLEIVLPLGHCDQSTGPGDREGSQVTCEETLRQPSTSSAPARRSGPLTAEDNDVFMGLVATHVGTDTHAHTDARAHGTRSQNLVSIDFT